MTQEEKQLLLIDLCARLPYRVRGRFCDGVKEEIDDVWEIDMFSGTINADYIDDVRPYLRPLSSMTKEERNEWMEITHAQEWLIIGNLDKATDWFNKNHFDYRGLIPKGLALEAPEGMYKTE